jgi:hypothetical protein
MSPRETSARARGEERRARVRPGATAGVTTAIRTSSLVRPFGSREVLCISSTFDEINSPHFHYGSMPTTNRTSRSGTIPDLRSDVIVAQCPIGVKMPRWKALLSQHEGRPGLQLRAGRPPPALAVAPQPALCDGWSSAETLVRKTSRVDHVAAR